MMMACGCEENVTLNKVIVSLDCDSKIYSFATYFFCFAAMNNVEHVGVHKQEGCSFRGFQG